jgi:hypothetical protein
MAVATNLIGAGCSARHLLSEGEVFRALDRPTIRVAAKRGHGHRRSHHDDGAKDRRHGAKAASDLAHLGRVHRRGTEGRSGEPHQHRLTRERASSLGESAERRLLVEQCAELLAMVFLLLAARHLTTLHQITHGVLTLLDHPDDLGELRADWTLADSTVQELLRYISFAQVGGTFEIPSVVVTEFGPDGLRRREDVYSLDQLDDAWARFAELPPDSLQIPPDAATQHGSSCDGVMSWDEEGAPNWRPRPSGGSGPAT